MRNLCLGILATFVPAAAMLDLSAARVVAPATDKKAVAVLVEEVEKRSQIRWRVESREGAAPAIIISRDAKGGAAEGYTIRVESGSVRVTGNDARGVLFGVGRLLRELRMSRGKVELPDDFRITTTPVYPLRGHQLGYRPKTNSYDGWTVAMWDQYIRDLAVFGANAIELIPPRSDDAPDSPHFPMPQMQMMIEMSRIAADYGLDLWIWYPAMDKDYSDPKTVENALKEWGEVFRKLPRIDHVMVPGGDPGHTQPKHLMALLEKQTQVLRKSHPKAKMWVSPQGFSVEWFEEFAAILKDEPAWLEGIVYGPQVRGSIEELRRRVPKRYPIRNYPDITHSTHCQHVVPDWDVAHALTHSREPINPRPNDMAAIFRHQQPHTAGFLTYSEGCNDDVNKIVWSALGWDPSARLAEVLRQYGRYFISERFAEGVAQGLFALERNWRGPLVANSGVETALEQFQAMERMATPPELLNWRLQMALYRAYYDALNRRRLIRETAVEEQALDALAAAPRSGSLAALNEAETILDRGATEPVAPQLRQRVFELAEALFQSIRMQTSVPRYQAIGRDRGATLDNVDLPLNNRAWLKQRFAEIRRMASESERLKGIDEVLNWTNPGPGGFYDDLGNPSRQPHLVRYTSYGSDPGHLRNPFTGFARGLRSIEGWRISWITDSESMYDAPVELEYRGLDPSARYKVRVVYGGEQSTSRVMGLVADERFEIQPYRLIQNLTERVEYDIPAEATADGDLRLKWTKKPGLPGSGRGNQIAEVWLIRK